MIVDPIDPSQAIAPSGKMAAKVYFIPTADAPVSMTPREIEEATRPGGDAVQIGWADPTDLGPGT